MVFAQPLYYRSLPPVVKFILTASGALFLAQWILGLSGHYFLAEFLGFSPWAVLHRGWFWQAGTYIFIHTGFFHFLFSAFMLWGLGKEIENRWGSRTFAGFVAATALATAALCALFARNSTAPLLGLSGVVMGLLVAGAFLFPEAVIYYIFIPLRMWQAAVLGALVIFMFGLSSGGPRAYALAPLGGMAAAFFYMRSGFWRWSPAKSVSRFVDWRREKAEEKQRFRFHELGEEVDRILEKISQKGIGSLTKDEEKLMQRYSRLKK